MPAPLLRKKEDAKPKQDNICVFAATDFRNQMQKFGIKADDRMRHMYIIGKTGMGKSTMMENMMLHDIYTGNGVALVDPHGDFAEKIIDYVPSWRINDVVYFNPADIDYPIGFNILEIKDERQRHLIVAGLMGTFKKIWPDAWSSRMEYILNNTLLALLEAKDSTLLGINRMLSDNNFRKKVLTQVNDPVVKAFWTKEFAGYNDRYASEAVAPIQNKIGQFLSASVIRNMVAQVKSSIDIREIMDSGKIFIMNLSKGRIGEDNSRLLGGMLITKIQLAAMERVDIPEHERKDFLLYVDEFQNFATPSFATILSEARKYHLGLIMAHQYVAQLDEVVADAVFGNVGTIVSFRVGGADADMLVKEFTPVFTEEDLVNLTKFHIFLKLMINGVASSPFSAITLPPLSDATGSTEKVIRVSRERYGRKKEIIEEKIQKWSDLDEGADDKEKQGQGTSRITVKRDSGAPKGAIKPKMNNNGKGNNHSGQNRPPQNQNRNQNRDDNGRKPQNNNQKNFQKQNNGPKPQKVEKVEHVSLNTLQNPKEAPAQKRVMGKKVKSPEEAKKVQQQYNDQKQKSKEQKPQQGSAQNNQ